MRTNSMIVRPIHTKILKQFANAGTINYDTGRININEINIISVSAPDATIRLTIESEDSIVESSKNTIITIDTADVTSIVTTLTKAT